MGTKCLIAIKKRRRTTSQQKQQQQPTKQEIENESTEATAAAVTPEESPKAENSGDTKSDNLEAKMEQDPNSRAEAYVRENFVVWQCNQFDGYFKGVGVRVYDFLRKFVYKWSEEQRQEYIDNLDKIQECSSEVEREARRYIRPEFIRIPFLLQPLSQRMNNAEYVEHIAANGQCTYEIFELLSVKKGEIKMEYADWDFPIEYFRECSYGYIVDFDRGEFHVLSRDASNGYTSSDLLYPLEQIYGRRCLYLVRKFKFSALPWCQSQFVDILENPETRPELDSFLTNNNLVMELLKAKIMDEEDD